MYVPLFIKVPDQAQGTVNDRLVETIDILPSVTSVLDLKIPWKPMVLLFSLTKSRIANVMP